MDNYNHLMHPGYGNMVYPPHDLPPINSIQPPMDQNAPGKRIEQFGHDGIVNAAAAGSEHITSGFSAYSSVNPRTTIAFTNHSIGGFVTPTQTLAPVVYSTVDHHHHHVNPQAAVTNHSIDGFDPYATATTTATNHNIGGFVPPRPSLAPVAYSTVDGHLNATTTVTDLTIGGYVTPRPPLVPVTVSTHDLEPLQSSQLQSLDPVLKAVELSPVNKNKIIAAGQTTINLSPVVALKRVQVISQTILVPASKAKQNPASKQKKIIDLDSDDGSTYSGQEDDDEEIVVRREIEKGEEIDKNQCRICMSKEELVDIFKFDDDRDVMLCDIIMMLCTPMRISSRDYLPHFVCTPCMSKLFIVFDLKKLAIETDKELRVKLKRSKIKTMASYVTIDCDELSSGSDDDKSKDDDEFHLSEVEVPESDDDYESDDGKVTEPRNRPTRRKCAIQSCSNHTKGDHAQTNKRKGPDELIPESKRANKDIEHEGHTQANQTHTTTE